MPDYLWLIIIPAFIALIIFALLRKKRVKAEAVAQMQARYGEEAILVLDADALYYGIKSKGQVQSHQLGTVFVLTQELIHVKNWVSGPGVTFEAVIPLERLHGLAHSQKWIGLGPLGKVSGDGLLILSYPDDKGAQEELALMLSKDKERDAIAQIQEHTGLSLENRND